MKKTGKLAVLFLILAMLCGVFAVVSSADYATKILVNSDCSNNETDAGKIHTNEADGNSYLSYFYTSVVDHHDFAAVQTDAFDGTWSYLTFDFDLMTETTYESGSGTNIYIMARNSAGNPKGMNNLTVVANDDGTAKLIASKTRETYEIPGKDYSWIHITGVLKIDCTVDSNKEVTEDRSVFLTYVNGQLAFKQESVMTLGSRNLTEFRLQSATKTVSDSTVCVDNVNVTLYGKDYDGNLTKLFDGKDHTLDEDEYDVVYNKDYKLPFGKQRAGLYNLAGYETAYENAQEAFAAAKDGYEVKLYEDISDVTIDRAITVNANGYNFSWKPGNYAVSTSERDGDTIYTFSKTDRFAYFTFYPDGPYGAPEGDTVAVPVGSLPVYEGDRLKLTYEDADGYYVFDGWSVFGESPLTAVTSGDVDSYYDLYPSYKAKKAPTTGKIVSSYDCENSVIPTNSTNSTYAKSGLVKANGNGYYRYYATLDASGNSNPGGTSGYIQMDFGKVSLTELSYFILEFDISSENVPAEGKFHHIGRNSSGNPNGSTTIYVKRNNGKMVFSVNNASFEVAAREWAHLTLVSQVNGTTGANVSTILFVNGERIATLSGYWGSSIVSIDDYRFLPETNNPEGATLCFDNVTTQTFDKTYTGSLSELFGDSGTDLNKKMYRDVMWSTDYELPSFAYVARVDGVGYSSVAGALAALKEGGTLELLCDITDSLTVDRRMTLVTNGFKCDFTHAGFDVEEKESGVYTFTVTTKSAYYTFHNLDGTVLAKDVPALYGAMPSPGIGFVAAVESEDGALLAFTGWLRDGSPLTKVSGEDIDGHFEVYPQIETVTDYCAYIYDKDGMVTVITKESDIPAKLAAAKNDSTFVFACDYYIASRITVGNVYIDLNGHTVSSGGKADVTRYSPLGISGTTRIYSSKKGGYLRVAPVVKDGVEQNYSGKNGTNFGTMPIFDQPRGALVLGTVYNPTLDKTFDGDNLTMSGGPLINSDAGAAKFSVTIDGGHYFSVLNDYAAPIITRWDLKDFTIRNAEIYTNRIALIAFQGANGAEIHFDNCRIYMSDPAANLVTNNAGASGADPSGTVYLTNTEVYGGNVNVAGANGHIVIGENCVIPAIGTLNTGVADGCVFASGFAVAFSPSEELTKFLGYTVDVTASVRVAAPKDLVTVIWSDGTSSRWFVGTLPTHVTSDNKMVIDGWLCSTDGTWTFKDAEGNVLDFETLPDSLKGSTVYAETNYTREKEVYATLSYGSTVEYFSAGTIAEVAARLQALGKVTTTGPVTLTFHRDIIDPTRDGIVTGNDNCYIDVYIDLNGHRVEAKTYFYSYKGEKNCYIYSSKPGAVIKTGSELAHNFCRNYSHAYIGTVTARDGYTYDGDNLTVYTGQIFGNGSYNKTICTYHLHVNGGTYYLTQAVAAMDAWGSVNVTLENATIFAGVCVLNVKTGRTGNLTVSDCEIYLGTKASFIGTDTGTGSLSISDSLIYGAAVGKAGSFTLTLSGNIVLTHLPDGAVTIPTGCCLAHAPTETVTFTDGVGATYTYTVAYRLSKLTDVITVEWKSGAASVKDYWLPGTTVACTILPSAVIDPSDERYALIPTGEWIYVMNGGIIGPVTEAYMAGVTIVATPRSFERVRMSFVVIRPDGKIEPYTATDFATFKKVVEAITDASRVIMHTDYTDIANATVYLNGNGIELDINGHSFTSPSKNGNGNLFNINTGAGKTAYIYSSKPGACLRSGYSTATKGGFSIIVRSNSTLKVGENAKGTVYDRENLLICGTCAVQILSGSASFRNITYLADIGDNAGLFQFNGSATITVQNCRLVVSSSVSTALFAARENTGFIVNVSDSEIYIPGTLTSRDYRCTGTGTLTMTGTTLICNNAWTAHQSIPVTIGAGCRFATDTKVSNTTLASGMTYARVTPTGMAVTIDGTTYLGTVLYETCASANTANVTWKNGTNETKELWKKGEIPTNDTEISTGDTYIKGVYRCDAPLTADMTVNLTYTLLLPMKENLTLTANFIYNLYIPADASEITSVTIDGKAYTLDKTVDIDGVPYYVISYTDITPRDAAKDITVVITAKASDGTPYEKTMTLSIFGYAEKLLAGDPSKETEQLVVDMLAYIRAAYCYFTPAADRDTARVDALLEGRTPSTPKYSEQVADLGTLSKVLFGASLSLDGTPAFAFRVKSDFRGILTVSYTDNDGNVVSRDFDYTEGGNAYILVTMSVADMRKTLTLTAKTTTEAGTTETVAEGSYDLDTYIAGIKADVIPDFAARLYAYAASAEAYLKAGN